MTYELMPTQYGYRGHSISMVDLPGNDVVWRVTEAGVDPNDEGNSLYDGESTDDCVERIDEVLDEAQTQMTTMER